MPTTRVSVLEGAILGGDHPDARWFVDLYQPLIRGTLVKLGVHPRDADDLTQDVLLNVVRGLPKFHHNGQKGAFRKWLRTITANGARESWRKNKHRLAACGGSDFMQMVEQLEDPKSRLSIHWDNEHDKQVLHGLLKLVEPEFDKQTLDIFYQRVFDNTSSAEVAAKLGITAADVHHKTYLVLRRLREEANGLLDVD